MALTRVFDDEETPGLVEACTVPNDKEEVTKMVAKYHIEEVKNLIEGSSLGDADM